MLVHEEKIRVRYGETDQMGYVYYGNYALYYEIGRVELLRKLGISYREIEERGIGLPVLSFEIKYFKPGRYDDLITLKTRITDKPNTRITFHYECFNEQEELMNHGKITLVFVDKSTGKPIRCPEDIEQLFNHFS